MAATNLDLRSAIRAGTFREDLYFRVSTFRINVPGLKSRLDDILPLANFFLVKHGSDHQDYQLSPDASSKLLSYAWPGNVRELRNLVERISILSQNENKSNITRLLNEILNKNSTQNLNETTTSMSYPLKQARENFEKNYLLNQLRKNKGNISKTAEFIGMERSALHRKLKSLGIKGIN